MRDYLVCLWCCWLLIACGPATSPAPKLYLSVTPTPHARVADPADYGAVPDDGLDDRAAIQAAIDAVAMSGGGTVQLAHGVWDVGRAGSAYWCLQVPARVTLRGDGEPVTRLRQMPGLGASVRLLQITGPDVVLRDLTLDGQRALQTVDEHRGGFFAVDADRLRVENVTLTEFTGDGGTFYNNVHDASLWHVTAAHNGRDGIALTPSMAGVQIDNLKIDSSRLIGNAAQQLDSEPGGSARITNVSITNSLLDGLGTNDYAITVSGTGTATRGSGWRVVGNVINGGVNVTWCEDVVIANNTGVNPTTKPSVYVYRSSGNVIVIANQIKMTQQTTASMAGIWVVGTGVGNTPARVLVANNEIFMSYAASFGIRAEGLHSLMITDNELRGAGQSAAVFYAGIYVRATIQTDDARSAIIRGNRIANFGSRGITIAGNVTAHVRLLEVSHNVFDDDSTVPSMTTGVSLDDGTHIARQLIVADNAMIGGVATLIINDPRTAGATP